MALLDGSAHRSSRLFMDQIRNPNLPEEQNALNDRMLKMIAPRKLMAPEVFGGPWQYLLPIDGARAALFTGSAGVGKSHVLTRSSETAWNEGIPVLHLLGQYFLDDDPRTSILKRLEITNWSFHEALTAFKSLPPEAKKTRALLVIDALNEGRGTEIWRKHLGTFVQELNEHKHIMLAVSCREEYLHYVVPSESIAQPQRYPDKKTKHVEDCAPLGKLVHMHVRGYYKPLRKEKRLFGNSWMKRTSRVRRLRYLIVNSSILWLCRPSADPWQRLD